MENVNTVDDYTSGSRTEANGESAGGHLPPVLQSPTNTTHIFDLCDELIKKSLSHLKRKELRG